MNKKKLIWKMAIPAAIIFAVCIIALLLESPISRSQYKKQIAKLNEHVTALTEENQKYLDEIAGKVAAVDMNEISASPVVAGFQSEFRLEHQKVNRVKRYLWMSDLAGEFLFGAPEQPFEKLNSGFDDNRELISKDGHYRDRNHFFAELVDKYDRIDFSDQSLPEKNSLMYFYHDGERKINWRFYSEQQAESGGYYSRYIRPRTFVLSTPVIDQAGTVQGTLFMKIDDSATSDLYSRSSSQWLFTDFLVAFASFSAIFLWFLVPTWVYIDAQQREVNNPGIWAFITLISLIFGLAIYLVSRPAHLKSLNCPKCENELNGGGAFCPHCGFDLSSTYCPQCQYPIKQDWAFCPNCRAEVAQPKPIEAPPEPSEQSETPPDKDDAG